jgi:hypothetical protein
MRIMVDFLFSHQVALSLRNTNGTPPLFSCLTLYHLNSSLLNLLEISLAAGIPTWLRNVQVVNWSSHRCDIHPCCTTAVTSLLNVPSISWPLPMHTTCPTIHAVEMLGGKQAQQQAQLHSHHPVNQTGQGLRACYTGRARHQYGILLEVVQCTKDVEWSYKMQMQQLKDDYHLTVQLVK